MNFLDEMAARLRIDSVRATTAAGSGHPTSCASAAEIVSVLFFSVMRFDPRDPANPAADRFILSKGHAAPLLYAAWANAGAFPRERLLTLRQIDSDLEGHPTTRLPFVDVATGSLGQGLPAGLGMALAARLDGSGPRIYVLMGDGESAEGSVWEAAEIGGLRKVSNLCAIIDINRLGQSEPTMLQHDVETLRQRWEAFGWHAIPVDGHDTAALKRAFAEAEAVTDRPSILLARTFKGHGLLDVEDREGEHGKPLPKDAADRVVASLEAQLGPLPEWHPKPLPPAGTRPPRQPEGELPAPSYEPGGKPVATRKAFGDALAALAGVDRRIVVLDGDVKNSTHTEEFERAAPERFFQCYIAEQNMVGMATGFAASGHVPFAATFGCFLTRAYDFIRMAAISGSNIKLAGTHAGVSIGEDGPSQMALEDLAMTCAEPNFTVLYPCDATSAWRATELCLATPGPCYLRLARPASPVIYGRDEQFAVGRAKVLRQSDRDRVLVVAAGITVFEALAAHDELAREGVAVRVIDLFSVQPVDRETLTASARAVNGLVITVEDHYEHGGLGDAVASALAEQRPRIVKLAIAQVPRSGKGSALMERFGISARHIVAAVRGLLAAGLRAGDPQ
ncbi:MAG: transketolase [bacterium]|jgi:transketolase